MVISWRPSKDGAAVLTSIMICYGSATRNSEGECM
jgi:hypothetical protein